MIQDLLTKGEDEHWQIGAAYNRIVDGQLAQKAGYKNAEEYFAKNLRATPESTLRLYGAIAKAFPEQVAKRYGVSTLRSLLTYEKLSHSKLPKGDPAQVLIAVPQKDGATTKKRFADCTYVELKAAIHHLEAPDKPEPLPPEYRKDVEN